MQFYLNGYKTGDPFVEDPHPSVAQRPGGLPEEVDVLIIGCGPAGLVLAAQMANFPDIRTAVIDRRDGPLEVGQADGVACRTVEMFEAFGLADRLVNEAYWVNEVSFWRPDPDDRSKITRTGRVLDTEEGLSEFPHVIVNQARMLAYLLDHMERSASRLRPFYGLQVSDVDISEGSEYPVTVTVERADGTATIRARYVVGCDGARSRTRTAIGRELIGDATNESWGVMDVLAVTDFPDIRLKCAIYAAEGNILIIPREGGHLVRFYIALDEVTDKDDARQPDGHPGSAGPRREPDPAPLHRRGQRRRVVLAVPDRPASMREVRRRAGAGDGHPPAAGVHRRRRLPHAQRQGRPGHERVDGRYLEPRVEAGRRPAGNGQARAPAHLLRRAAGDRPAADRLRPRVLRAVQRRLRRPGDARRSSSATSPRKAASRRAWRPATPRR